MSHLPPAHATNRQAGGLESSLRFSQINPNKEKGQSEESSFDWKCWMIRQLLKACGVLTCTSIAILSSISVSSDMQRFFAKEMSVTASKVRASASSFSSPERRQAGHTVSAFIPSIQTTVAIWST